MGEVISPQTWVRLHDDPWTRCFCFLLGVLNHLVKGPRPWDTYLHHRRHHVPAEVLHQHDLQIRLWYYRYHGLLSASIGYVGQTLYRKGNRYVQKVLLLLLLPCSLRGWVGYSSTL